MILEKLSKIEIKANNNINREYRKIQTLRGIENLLNQIDFSSEVVPINDDKRLIKVLASLKGKQLNKCEIKLVEEIIRKK